MTELTVEGFGTGNLVELLQELFGFPDDRLGPMTTLGELELDSLALMELGAVVEERTGLEVASRLTGLSGSESLERVAGMIAGVAA
ncbi:MULTISPECIES: acyl carrier protein [unclassified Streptomyces]|uniref:acyl carrier protein n=1 Tax=unclassified Streptomyces TaxID=2593676 RepID=UPI002E2E46F4|nr:acyl carrier protein [Streptomyces sp. NBC_01423]WSX89073.1 acyl carrier protein [Streptomyces sp. NBC_00891]WSY03552.1 acyl carrier protein [Streptomyces sp. NBC_00890]WSZ05179.1 acyl carrier protein [Streptomyces sp. NBC_00869]WSZ27326.1 acyl carrier protein [Streptomyces sp. NBC_00870]